MGGDSSKSYLGKIVPLKLKEVTSNCITLLKVTPLARAIEEHRRVADADAGSSVDGVEVRARGRRILA